MSLKRTVVIDTHTHTHTHTLTASCLETPKELLSSSEMLQQSPLTSTTKRQRNRQSRIRERRASLSVPMRDKKKQENSASRRLARPSHNLRCDWGKLPCALIHNIRQECFPAPLCALGTMATVSLSERAFAKSLSDVSSSVQIY